MKRLIPTIILSLAAATANAYDLLETYELALDQDPVLKQALAKRNANRQAKPLAISQFLPQINAAAESTSIQPIILSNSEFTAGDVGVIKDHGYSLSAQQNLLNIGTWFSLWQANNIYNSADAQYTACEQALIIRVASAYFTVLDAEDNLEFAVAEKKAFGQQLEQTEEKFNVGLVAITDLNDFRARYDESVANEIEARNNVDDAKELLEEIINTYVAELQPLKQNLPLESPDPSDLNEWVKFSQEHNPLLAAAQYAAEAQKNNVGVQQSQHLPSVNVSGTYGESRTGTVTSPGSDHESGWAVMFNAQMNIFSGGGITAQVRQAQYEYEDAKQVLEKTRRDTVANTRIAYRGVLTSIGRVEALNQAVISAQSSLQSNEAAYEVGTKTAVDVTDAISQLYGTKRSLAAARYDYILNLLQLKQAAGTLSIYDVAYVNEWLAGNVSNKQLEQQMLQDK
jgi:outer membrane protein